ncbi:anti-sigma factor antagonist [Blastococcus sp. CT_GayMR19]|uniref:STAS domain-containing protein n=1 Tax=Blastococcus sp. CT_GayMR19 TaxID=2559608 RepID=UPI0010747FBF|nr:STAS domain-containing protein [Blastococcus sp. CT_GayMR19]TFV78499.1 anti-sigma factor antagonist [Blastococcus sp. CT_GayMR19]
MVSSPPLERRTPELCVSPVAAGPRLVVVVAGEADWVTAPRLREQLTAALAYGPRLLILDLTDLEFCNSAGVRALLAAVDVALQAGVQVEMRGMSPLLSRLHSRLTTRRGAAAMSIGPRPGRPGCGRARTP